MNNNTENSIRLLNIILVINIVFKLIGIINWNWWIVIWPLWAIIIII